MSILRSLSTVSLVLVMGFLTTSGLAQSGSNGSGQKIQPNFYITTPQTGERTMIGTDSATRQVVKSSDRSADSTMNFYVSSSERPAAKSATSSRANNSRPVSGNQSSQKVSIQQVAHSPISAAQIGQGGSGQQSASRQAANSTRTNYTVTQPQQIQQTYPNYVSAGTPAQSGTASARQGLLSKVFHKHDHTASASQPTARTGPSISPSKQNGVTQNGMASWYGKDFHGGKTANGERYNMDSMTAAHKTLPFGTMIKVRNERNGQECVVRINNRGPFTKGRILDLSRAAARELGMINSGIARVSMQVIGKSSS